MTKTSFDPRKAIREKIGTLKRNFDDKINTYNLQITVGGSIHNTVNVPMYLAEEVKSGTIKEMPYMDMNLADCSYEPHDILASTRKVDCYIDIGLWFADTDNVDVTSFGKKVCDQISNLIRTHQSTTDGITFMNVESIVNIREIKAHQVIYHVVITVYCLYYDLCS